MAYKINRKSRFEDVDFVSSPNRSGKIKPDILVLHDTAGRLSGTGSVAWLTDRKASASAHLVIDREGKVTQLVPFDIAAWHAGRSTYNGRHGVNSFSIGIELVNPGRLQSSKGKMNAKAWYGSLYHRKTYGIEWKDTPEHGMGYWMPYTDEQLYALEQVTKALVDHYDLKDITTHYAISPRRKVDVNPLFPIDAFRAKFGFTGEMGGA